MFDIGFLELVLCGIVALVVLGPEKLPHAARMAGALIGRLTRMANSVREEIEREVNVMEMQERIKKQVEQGVLGDLRDNVEQAKKMLREGYEQGTALPGAATPGVETPAAGLPVPDAPAALTPPADETTTVVIEPDPPSPLSPSKASS